MYYNNFNGRYQNRLNAYRQPQFIQIGSGPNFRNFSSSVYSGLRPLFSSAFSALKGSAKHAGLAALENFKEGKDLEFLVKNLGETFNVYR